MPQPWRRPALIVSSAVAAGVTALLFRASLQMVLIERESRTMVASVPTWTTQLVLPLAFLLIGLRLVWRADHGWLGRGVAALGVATGAWLGQYPQVLENAPPWPGLAVVLIGAILGSPIFAILGGVAVLLFMRNGVPIAAMPVETYRLAVSPTLAAVPLFTLTGYLLSEGHASRRLVGVFRAFFGWIPGGTAVVVAVVCAFFTAFTGGSGVTILALGALLFQALRQDQYRERFSLGLITACGSLGLLFPPSMPIILYGIVAQIPIEDLFIGGILPGFLLLGMVAVLGSREGMKTGAGRHPFEPRVAVRVVKDAAFELLLPVIVMIAILDRKSTRLNSSHVAISYAVFCLKKKKRKHIHSILPFCR